MRTKPKNGDRVSILVPGKYERYGIVLGTDYHPFGIDDAVQIRFEGEPGEKPPEWWDIRYVSIRNNDK